MTRIIGLRPVVWVRRNKGDLTMYEFMCKWCGKKQVEATSGRTHKLFCDATCLKAYNNYRREATAQAKKEHRCISKYSDTITPESQCQLCVYGTSVGGTWCCDYWEIMQCTRHSLHPEGLPGECQEFERRTKGRKRNGMTVKRKQRK
jgi:hypothetical protein